MSIDPTYIDYVVLGFGLVVLGLIGGWLLKDWLEVEPRRRERGWGPRLYAGEPASPTMARLAEIREIAYERDDDTMAWLVDTCERLIDHNADLCARELLREIGFKGERRVA